MLLGPCRTPVSPTMTTPLICVLCHPSSGQWLRPTHNSGQVTLPTWWFSGSPYSTLSRGCWYVTRSSHLKLIPTFFHISLAQTSLPNGISFFFLSSSSPASQNFTTTHEFLHNLTSGHFSFHTVWEPGAPLHLLRWFCLTLSFKATAKGGCLAAAVPFGLALIYWLIHMKTILRLFASDLKESVTWP